MVGVPRSSGCALCVKRRVKCDERTPGCAKCETYGKPCPGYDRAFKFVAGKPHRGRRQPGSSSGKADERSKSARTSVIVPVQSAYQFLIQRESPSSMVSADLNVFQHLCILIDDFSQPVSANRTHSVSRWFGFLPSIYGQSRTLDATIKSFTAHHIGRITQNKQMVLYAQTAYGEALCILRKSLQNPSERLSSHVFCAVVLLCIYELFTDTEDPQSWMKHVKGLSQLVQIRGPGRYRSELDITLLKASRGLIVMHSMFSGEACFLASDEWHRIMQQRFSTSLPTESYRSIEQFFAHFTQAPSLVHKFYSLKDMEPTSPEALQMTSELLSKTLEVQHDLAVWYEGFSRLAPRPVEAISSTGDDLYPIVLLYSDVGFATIFCSYYAYKVIIHEILKTCIYPGQHEATTIYFRDQICRSIEYNGIGILGPYRMGFPLRVAFEVADPVTRSWILGHLERFSKIYAAAQSKDYQPIS
ncbi:hypothetical protein NUU61_005208 [Penicillium alfredii]|uniref:Zn(2)-C6 fungal-type domain-containing protein n=1 Tax=Penicillium alfredii TaxID=1506179 RepID=A0A9W9K8C8_9EURO|nr:uncharacterized protein NUU61_005208 [Penicillium alfredii]KAJ5095852.1 hypothetical protein NUU61_005208 [Penicillium alfredii]